MFKKANAADFIRCQDAVSLLGSVNQIVFETEEEKEWLAMELTTSDVKANCEDLKVLGKGDFKALMKWRTALREEVRVCVVSIFLYPQVLCSLDLRSRRSSPTRSPRPLKLQKRSMKSSRSKMKCVAFIVVRQSVLNII